MVTIQEKAISYAKKSGGCFLVRNLTTTSCCCTGHNATVTGLSVELVKDFKKENIHDEYEFDGVKIYMVNSLILKEDVYIFMLPKIPFMKPIFDAKGVELKRY